MKLRNPAVLWMIPIFLLSASAACAQEKASPLEVVQKVREAAAFLSSAGDAGLAEFSDRAGRWVWKDTYVWVLECGKMTDVAHPINPKLIGKNLAGMKDVKGNYLFIQMCEAAKKEGGSWVEYWWPQVETKETARKLTYLLQVPNSPYQVGAGIYDENISMDELNGLLRKSSSQ